MRRLPPRSRPGEAAEQALCLHLKALGIAHEVQYPWGRTLSPPREFLSDAAVPAVRLLIEVDGRAHIAGWARFCKDMKRRRLATFAGWHMLAFTPAEAEDGTAALEVERFLTQLREKARS